MTDLKTTIVSFEDFSALDFMPPSNLFFKNAIGDYIFIHTRDRKVAQAWVDDYSGGKRLYTINNARLQKTTKEVTAR